MPHLQRRPNWLARKGSVGFNAPAVVIPPSGLLVDEVANEAALASHPDVLWYPGPTGAQTLYDILPDDWWGNQGGDPDWFGFTAGWEAIRGHPPAPPGEDEPIVDVPEYGTRAVRWGSQYPGQTFYDGATIQSWRKWINENTKETTSPAVQTGPLAAGYMRFMVMLEADVEAGFNELGLKLSGFEPVEVGGPDAHSIAWYAPPSGGVAALHHYTASTTFGQEHPSAALGVNLVLGQWHCIEIYMKMNSTVDTSDGEHRMWLDDVLVLERTNFKWAANFGANGLSEIGQVRGQIYHGGVNNAPDPQIHHRQFGYCLATRRIGAAKLI